MCLVELHHWNQRHSVLVDGCRCDLCACNRGVLEERVVALCVAAGVSLPGTPLLVVCCRYVLVYMYDLLSGVVRLVFISRPHVYRDAG